MTMDSTIITPDPLKAIPLFPVGARIRIPCNVGLTRIVGEVVAVREDRHEMLIIGGAEQYSQKGIYGVDWSDATLVGCDPERFSSVIEAFMARPSDDEKTADAGCYYCGCPATGWNNGERACTGCGG